MVRNERRDFGLHAAASIARLRIDVADHEPTHDEHDERKDQQPGDSANRWPHGRASMTIMRMIERVSR